MSTPIWAVLGLTTMLSLATAGCNDSNGEDNINLPIPGNAQAYILIKQGSTFEIERLYNANGGNDSGPEQTITGLPVGEELVGMDFRPRDGKLYLVGRNGSTAQSLGAIYVINSLPETGALAASLVSDLVATPDDSLPFTGFSDTTSYGVDFNPQANALRIVGSAGENLRIPFGGAGVIPVQLTVTTDTALTQNGAAKTGIIAAAYTNNLDAVASTSLLVLSNNELFQQVPPNDGVLISRGNLNQGGAAVDPAASGFSFDILTVSGADTGFFLGQNSNAPNEAAFGSIDLLTGALTVLKDTEDFDDGKSLIGLAMKTGAF